MVQIQKVLIAKNIFFKDLKPANAILKKNEKNELYLKLIDFGSVLLLEENNNFYKTPSFYPRDDIVKELSNF